MGSTLLGGLPNFGSPDDRWLCRRHVQWAVTPKVRGTTWANQRAALIRSLFRRPQGGVIYSTEEGGPYSIGSGPGREDNDGRYARTRSDIMSLGGASVGPIAHC